MEFHFCKKNEGIANVYYVANDKQLEYIINHQHKIFPVRFFGNKTFYPILDKEYATRVASTKQNWDKEIRRTHVLRFLFPEHELANFVRLYIPNVSNSMNAALAISQNELAPFNQHIIGLIERIETYNFDSSTN